MFNLDKKNKIESILPLITRDYKPILQDDEDIIFTGKNDLDFRIIGSIAEDDSDKKELIYFHTITDVRGYLDFLNRKVTYYDYLKKSKEVFIIVKNYQKEVTEVYLYDFEFIPKEYLPLQGVYCPELENKYSLDYALRFKGKLSDTQMAFVEDLTRTQLAFEKVLKKALDVVKDLKLNPIIYQVALEPKSIRLGYNIKFDKDLFPTDEMIARYLTSYIEYTLLDLPKDTEFILEKDTTTQNFELLKEEVKKIYNSTAKNIPDNIDDKIKEELIKSVSDIEDISDNLGNSFDTIEVYKSFEDNAECFGLIDTEYRDKINIAADIIAKKGGTIIEDTEATEYYIFIYHLNTETRCGNAIIFTDKDKKSFSRPRIKITGDEPLEATKYAESLYLKKEIRIKGKAKRYGDIYRYISIEYEK